ncbi:DMT family transporter [Rhodoferax sp. BAB1]|uniref:DMT family transporter n=1 Tax=Rhodoferax sp. BAB1 TaxID=2741720 RepID=UPI0015752677|nr:DMT family transporter [Rhodoferax sp. BAB1]QKO21769.1 DMT family transporter [Rhodoferax sp. BAB1]
MKLTHRRAVWLMVAVTLMWSIAGVVTRQLEAARSFEVTFWRSFFTALTLLLILALWRGPGVWRQLRTAPAALWWSGLCWGAMFTSFMLALTMTSVAGVLVISSLNPLFTALLAWAFLRQRIAWFTWVAIALAGVGMVWMFGSQLESGSWQGMVVALFVPLTAAINWIVVQHAHAQGQDVDLVPSVLVGGVLSALATLPLAWPLQATAHDIGLLALLGGVQLAIPCTLLVICARVLKAPEISLLAQLEILFGILLVWIGAGERPGLAVLQGGALVLFALLANEWMAWNKKR